MSRWLIACLALLSALPVWARPPRLTLFITVDALGTDVVQRMRPRFKGGLAQLLKEGAYYPNVTYEYAELVTSCGHATLVTGANPWRHGIVSNRVFNRGTGKWETAYQDATHPVLEAPLAAEDSSPENLLTETLPDRVRLATEQRGKVIGIADKARSAIPFAGRLGQAYWFNPTIGRFVTGTYYTKETPSWLKAFNERKLPDAAFGKTWELLQPATQYSGEDDRPFEADVLGMGRTFPHALSGGLSAPGPQFFSAVATSPVLNDVVVQLAKTAISSEELGKDEHADWLGVSFSGIDRIYHHFGPYSWEMQDAMLRLDKSFTELLSAAEKAAGGKQNLLVVLTADHGGAAIPEEWAAMGLPAVRFNPATWFPQLNKELQAKFGVPDLVAGFEEIDVYLNQKLLADRKLDAAAVRRFVAAWLARQPPLALVLAKDDLDTPSPLKGYRDALRKGYHPERSGDVFMLPHPYRVSTEMPTGTSHGAPYAYENQIPFVLYGRNVRAGTVHTSANATDVAPTLASLMEIAAPASSEGKVLEVPTSTSK